GIAELVDEVRTRRFPGNAFGQVLVVLWVALGDVGAGEHHFRTHGLEVEDLLPAHLVRDDEDQAVALLLRHQGQGEARVAGRAFDGRVAGFVPAGLFRRLDHRQADAVLDRSTGIGAFKLEEEFARAGVEPAHAHHGRVADQLQDAVVDHGGSGLVWYVGP